MIGIGQGLPYQRRGGGSAIAGALATRAGISWQPWKLNTLFTDTAGTVPAAQPGDIIAVQKDPTLVTRQFQQTTLANRQILVRHPKRGRVNLLVGSATMSTQNVTTTAAQHTLSIMGTGTVTLTGTSTAGPLNGTGPSNRVSLTFTPTAGTLTLTVSGSVTSAQLQLGAAFDSLQTVSANGYDITESGQAQCWGLLHDGTNDNMATAATLDLSASDKVAVFVAVQKQQIASAGILIETSTNAAANNGSLFHIDGGSGGAGAAGYGAGSRGTGLTSTDSAASFPAGSYNVTTSIHNISGDRTTIRVNGAVSGTPATADKGTGNFGNYTVYKGSRAGSSFFFTGIDWGGCVVSGLDATTDATLIAAIEREIAQNTPTVTL